MDFDMTTLAAKLYAGLVFYREKKMVMSTSLLLENMIKIV